MPNDTSLLTPPQNSSQRVREWTWDGHLIGRWVWTSSDYSRENRIVSFLAMFETLCAITVYWSAALYFDTFKFLAFSLFAAPLLLLRSEQSIEKGVKWFLADFFDFEHWDNFSQRKKRLTCFALIGGLAAYAVASPLAAHYLNNLSGWPLFFNSAWIGAVAVAVAGVVALAVAVTGEGEGADVVVDAILST